MTDKIPRTFQLPILGFAGRIFGPAADEFAESLADRMREWRANNLLKILERVHKKIEESNLPEQAIREIPFGETFRAIEVSSKEDEETIQAMWANLIANSLRNASGIKIEKRYADLLSLLSPPDAALLSILSLAEDAKIDNFNRDIEKIKFAVIKAKEVWRIHPKRVRESSIQNLLRLRCVSIVIQGIDIPMSTFEYEGEMEGIGIGEKKVDVGNLEDFATQVVDAINFIADAENHGDLSDQDLGFLADDKFSNEVFLPEASYRLTPLGRDLISACSFDGSLE